MKTTAKESSQIRLEILESINELWGKVGLIEERSKTYLGEDDPVSETLGYLFVHHMNASMEIEDHIVESTNKFKSRSLDQLFDVLHYIFWSGPKNFRQIKDSHQAALNSVKKKYGVRRNTIADLCVRRLGLEGRGGTDIFLGLVEGWLFRNETDLQKLIKKHTEKRMHQKVDDFFINGGVIKC